MVRLECVVRLVRTPMCEDYRAMFDARWLGDTLQGWRRFLLRSAHFGAFLATFAPDQLQAVLDRRCMI